MHSLTWSDIAASLVVGGTLLAPAPAMAGTTLDRELIGNFTSPMLVTHAPGDESRLFVAQRGGAIRIVENGALLPLPFLDLTGAVDTGGEGGLLGMAFHPGYDRNGFFYVHYTRSGAPLTTIVARYSVSADPNVADATTAAILLSLGQPASNHNGGWIGFGPDDGYLYIALGDGGFSGSGPSRAQDISDQLLGKMLRVDVDGPDAFPADPRKNYAIPPGNPFVGIEGDDEIWALGLRNPFRCSFDRATGELYIADVGEGAWEEIDHQPAGGAGGRNYGWGCMEGEVCSGNFCTCNDPALALPIHVYPHSLGCAVAGGTVYRGCAIPELDGTYFFADYCSDRIWSFRYDGKAVSEFTDRTGELGPTNSPVAFGDDARGELYLVSLSGPVYRIIRSKPADPDPCAALGDIDGDGSVGIADLLLLLAAWGPCAACPEDLDGNGAVGISDLLLLLANWG